MRQVVLVSGPPGAGKSTLARPLAAALGFPLLSKDVLKETLFDALGQVDEDALVSSKRLGIAAMELLWRLAEETPRVVLEANFRPRSQLERDRLSHLSSTPVEVYCRVSPELAAQRYNDRGASNAHHAVHVARSVPLSAMQEYQVPVGLGPVIEVDTTAPVDAVHLARQVSGLLESNP